MEFGEDEGDSRVRAARFFAWLIHPIDPALFFEEYWEKKPLLIKREPDKRDCFKVCSVYCVYSLLLCQSSGYHWCMISWCCDSLMVICSIFQGWFDSKALEDIIAQQKLNYVEHVDVSKYEQGKKRELFSGGKVDPTEVWRLYKEEGCSIRFRHPQQFNKQLWRMCSLLEEYFGCVVGSNSYLTPAGTQVS